MAKKVQITIKNNPAQPWTEFGIKPDSDSIIIAEVSVPGATGENLNYAQIEFDGPNASDVYFINSGGTISTDKTKRIEIYGDNTIEVKFTARKPLKSIIKGYVVVSGQMLPGSSDQQEFSFEVQLDTLNLDIAPTDIYLGDKITAKASASAKGVPVANQWLTLDLNTNGPAKFRENPNYTLDNNGYSLTGLTGADGYLNVEIDASQWGADSLTLSLLEGTGGHLDAVTKEFEIKPPKDLLLDLVILSSADSGQFVACGDTGKDGRYLYQGYGAADGHAKISLHGFLGRTLDKSVKYAGQELTITILGDAKFNPQIFSDNNNIIDKTGKVATLVTDSNGVTPTLTISSDYICKGLIKIGGLEIIDDLVLPFEFLDPWTDVASVHSTFIVSPSIKNRLIFSNGRHFAGLQVLVQPKSPNVNLPIGAATISQSVSLIDNITGVRLGEGQFSEWNTYNTKPNEQFGTAVYDNGQQIFEEEQPNAADVSPAINYYITSTAYAGEKGETNSFTFGLEVRPTGKSIKQKLPSSQDRYGNYIGEAVPVAPIQFRMNGDVHLDPTECPSIRTIKERKITGDDLVITATKVTTANQSDYGPVNAAKKDAEDNYWRLFNFEAKIAEDRYPNPKSSLAFLNSPIDNYSPEIPYIAPNYVISRNRYSYYCYLLPFNISSSYPPNIPFPWLTSFHGYRDLQKQFKVKPVAGSIYFAWYANFTFMDDGEVSPKDVKITGYDEYGNDVDLLFSSGTIPDTYTNSGEFIKNWNPFTSIDPKSNSLQKEDKYKSFTPIIDNAGIVTVQDVYINVNVNDNGVEEELALTLDDKLYDTGWQKICTKNPSPSSSLFNIYGGPANDYNTVLDSTYYIYGYGYYLEPAKYRPYGDESTLWIAGADKNVYSADYIKLVFSPIWYSEKFAIFSTCLNRYYYCLKNTEPLLYASYPRATDEGSASINYEFSVSPP